jgi:hypothetical protein
MIKNVKNYWLNDIVQIEEKESKVGQNLRFSFANERNKINVFLFAIKEQFFKGTKQTPLFFISQIN